MVIPVYLLWNYVSPLPWYTGAMAQLAGLLFLYLTRFTGRYAPRWGRGYYIFSSLIRPLGIILIAWGWVELFSVSSDIPISKELFSIINKAGGITILIILGMALFDPFWRRIFLGGILFLAPTFFLFGTWLASPPAVLVLLPFCLFGMGLGAWSIWSLGIRQSLFYVRTDDPLVEQGPYRYCRHPQFAASWILVAVAVLIIKTDPRPDVVAFQVLNLLIFTAILIFIIFGEERDLQLRFGESGETYQTYCQRVPRFFFLKLSGYKERKVLRWRVLKVALIWILIELLTYLTFFGPLTNRATEKASLLGIEDDIRVWIGWHIRYNLRSQEFEDFINSNSADGVLPQTIPDYKKLFGDGLHGGYDKLYAPATIFYCDQIFLDPRTRVVNPPSARRRFYFSEVKSLPFKLNCTDHQVSMAVAMNIDADDFPMVWLQSWTLEKKGEKAKALKEINFYRLFEHVVLDDYTNEYTPYFQEWQRQIKKKTQ